MTEHCCLWIVDNVKFGNSNVEWIYFSMIWFSVPNWQKIGGNMLFYYAMKGKDQNHSHHFFCSSLPPLAATSPGLVWETQQKDIQSVRTHNPALNFNIFKKRLVKNKKNQFWIQLEGKQMFNKQTISRWEQASWLMKEDQHNNENKMK